MCQEPIPAPSAQRLLAPCILFHLDRAFDRNEPAGEGLFAERDSNSLVLCPAARAQVARVGRSGK